MNPNTIFFSYSRKDAQEFAFRLANDLRSAGANVWIDQLDIPPGKNWDEEIEKALNASRYVLFIASEMSVSSQNVLNEIYYAVDENKTEIPVLFHDCAIPFRIRRFQYIDFTGDYNSALNRLVKYLELQVKNEPVAPAQETPKEVETSSIAKPHLSNASAVSNVPPIGKKSKSKTGILIALGTIALAAVVVFGVPRKNNDGESISDDTSYVDSTLTTDTSSTAAVDSGVYSPGYDTINSPENTTAPPEPQQVQASEPNTESTSAGQDTDPDTPAFFGRSRIDFPNFLRSHMNYPEEARQDRIEGVVTVRFAIEEDGSIGEVEVLSGPRGGGLRREAIRLIKASPRWHPAKKDGHKVRSFRTFEVPFKLEE